MRYITFVILSTYRYLVFFDDGYAQYSSYEDVRKVYEQSKFFILTVFDTQSTSMKCNNSSIDKMDHMLI